MSRGGAYAPPGKARSFALRQADEDDKQAAALLSLAETLASARAAAVAGDERFAWSLVGCAHVSVRLLVRGLLAIGESAAAEASRFGEIADAIARAETWKDWKRVEEIEGQIRALAKSLEAKDGDE